LQLRNRGRDLIRVAGADRHTRPFAGKRARNRASDAARAPEHNGISSPQTQIHWCFPCSPAGCIVAAEADLKKSSSRARAIRRLKGESWLSPHFPDEALNSGVLMAIQI
jgi:hypothetical protein